MAAGRSVGVAGAVAALLWLMLDSRIVTPTAPPAGVSGSLVALALIFGAGAFVMAKGGQPERVPLLAGLALGVGGYALARLVLL
jgi:hypothetical protein